MYCSTRSKVFGSRVIGRSRDKVRYGMKSLLASNVQTKAEFEGKCCNQCAQWKSTGRPRLTSRRGQGYDERVCIAMLLDHLCIMSLHETSFESSVNAELRYSSPVEQRKELLQNASTNNLLSLLNDLLNNLLNNLILFLVSLLYQPLDRIERQASRLPLSSDLLLDLRTPRQPLV
jgi:hypothetical protein